MGGFLLPRMENSVLSMAWSTAPRTLTGKLSSCSRLVLLAFSCSLPPPTWVQKMKRTLSHYSCTCLEAEGGDRMEKLSSLERVHASLKFRRHLLQTGDGQVVGGAQVVLVAATMEVAMGLPAASPLPSLGVAVGGKARVR